MTRHKGFEWVKVQARLEASAEKLWSLNEMERTGSEPDVVGHDKKTGEYIFYDCSVESPKGRRSVCYDREALANSFQCFGPVPQKFRPAEQDLRHLGSSCCSHGLALLDGRQTGNSEPTLTGKNNATERSIVSPDRVKTWKWSDKKLMYN